MTAPILSRQQLAQFLPTQELIKAFESLFLQSNVATPTSTEELLQQLGTGRQFVNLQPLLNRIEELEIKVLQKQNLDGLQKRIEELEIKVLQKQNMQSLENRIFAIETFLVV